MGKRNKTLGELQRAPNAYKKVKNQLAQDAKRKQRRKIPTLSQVFDRIENADVAMKKLFLDEPLTDDELDALLKSDYLKRSSDDVNDEAPYASQTLYERPMLGRTMAFPILFTDIEMEVLAYFGRHPELLHSLSPRKFEELVATVFKNSGFDVELTPETRDGGVDIIAVRNHVLGGPTLHLVECKRYLPGNTIGIGVVQRMMGVVEQHRATQGLIVTTSTFTHAAAEAAHSSPYRLNLSDYTELSRWLSTFIRRPS